MATTTSEPIRLARRLFDAKRVTQVVFVAGLVVFGVMLVFSGGAGFAEQCVSAIAISPDGTLLAAGMYNARDALVPGKGYAADVCRTVEVFRLDLPAPGVVLAQEMRLGNRGPLHRTTPAMRFLDGGRQLAILLEERGVDVWDINTRRKLRSDSEGIEWVTGFNYSPDEKVVAIISGAGLSIQGLSPPTELRWIDHDVHTVFWKAPDVAFSPDGRLFTVAALSRKLTVWDSATGRPRHELAKMQNEFFDSVAFSPDSQFLAVGSADSIRVQNLESGHMDSFPRPVNTNSAYSRSLVSFLPDSRTLVAVGTSGVDLIDVETGQTVRSIATSPSRGIRCAAISPRGDLLATGDESGCVTVWDLATGKQTRELAIDGKYRTPWPVPAALLLIWLMLYRIVTKHRLFTWG